MGSDSLANSWMIGAPVLYGHRWYKPKRVGGPGFKYSFFAKAKNLGKCGLLSFGRKPCFSSEKSRKLMKVPADPYYTQIRPILCDI
tara:strand:+ start:1554 stop:1811 length:258 start_codon:yes stop_codon:yes gene_type:complete